MQIGNEVEMLVPMRVTTCLRKQIDKGVMMRISEQIGKGSQIRKPK